MPLDEAQANALKTTLTADLARGKGGSVRCRKSGGRLTPVDNVCTCPEGLCAVESYADLANRFTPWPNNPQAAGE